MHDNVKNKADAEKRYSYLYPNPKENKLGSRTQRNFVFTYILLAMPTEYAKALTEWEATIPKIDEGFESDEETFKPRLSFNAKF